MGGGAPRRKLGARRDHGSAGTLLHNDEYQATEGENLPLNVILGLDPRIGPPGHLARPFMSLACRKILGSSPRMTETGERG